MSVPTLPATDPGIQLLDGLDALVGATARCVAAATPSTTPCTPS